MFRLADFLHPDDPAFIHDRMADVERYYVFKYAVALMLSPESILEIGVRAGYSAAAFLTACPTARYHGIDADNGEYGGKKGYYLRAMQMLPARFPLAEIQISLLDTQQQSPEGKYDLAHIDGDHSYLGCMNDLRLVKKLGCKWALVDDIRHHADTVGRAVNCFLQETNCPHLYFGTLRGDCLIRLDAPPARRKKTEPGFTLAAETVKQIPPDSQPEVKHAPDQQQLVVPEVQTPKLGAGRQ